jgi:hypothetical protein
MPPWFHFSTKKGLCIDALALTLTVDMVLALTARPRIEPAVMAKERCREIFPGVLPKAPL